MYADDTALVTESEEAMHAAMDIVHEAFRKWGINVLNTKIMNLNFDDEPDVGDAMMLDLQRLRLSRSSNILVQLQYVVQTCL